MILFINACVRKESRTKRLADALLSEWDEPITEIRTVDIEKASRKACARQKSSIMSRLQGEILSPKSSASAMSLNTSMLSASPSFTLRKASRKACARQKSSIMSRLQGEILSPKSSASAMSADPESILQEAIRGIRKM